MGDGLWGQQACGVTKVASFETLLGPLFSSSVVEQGRDWEGIKKAKNKEMSPGPSSSV